MRKYLKVFCHKNTEKKPRKFQHQSASISPFAARDVILSHQQPHTHPHKHVDFPCIRALTDARNVNHTSIARTKQWIVAQMQTRSADGAAGWSFLRWLIITKDDAALSSERLRSVYKEKVRRMRAAVRHLFSKGSLWSRGCDRNVREKRFCVYSSLCPASFCLLCSRVAFVGVSV